MGLSDRYRAFDRFQQAHGWVGFPLAVRQKYSEDQGGYLAASVAYYGFFAIFPLLLVFVSVLGFVLSGHEHLQKTIVDSAIGQLPVVGHDLKVGSLSGNGLALALGIVGALWAGMGVFLAAENAMAHLWGIPHARRPDFARARGRALLLLLLLGGGALGTTVLAGAATVGAGYGLAWKLVALGASTALNVVLFWTGFRLLTPREITWRCLRGGAVAAGVLYELLQALGGYYVGHVVKSATNAYGTFALVIGLLSYIYLAAHITLLAAEGNVVATRGLWPRSFSLLFEQPATEADRRALRQRAGVEGRRQDQRIEVGFGTEEGER